MIQKPTFKACFHVEILPPDQVFLFDGKGSCQLLEGTSYVLLAPFLYDKAYSIDFIVKQLKKKLKQEEIYYALLRLENKGLIIEARNDLPKQLQAFCDHLHVSLDVACKKLKDTSISILPLGSAGSSKALIKTLQSLSLKVASSAHLTIVLTDDYRDPRLSSFNKKALKLQKPWLLVKAVGPEIWVGPLFVPKKTGCYECLSERIKMNHIEEEFIKARKKKQRMLPMNRATLPTSESMAFDLVANEVFKWVVQGCSSDLEKMVLSYNPLLAKIESHHFVQRPQCPCCGSKKAIAHPLPLTLTSQNKIFVEDGGHRTQHPEETYKKYQHLISPITGIVEQLIPSSSHNSVFMHVFVAGHNLAYLNNGKRPFKQGLRGASAGKGKTEIQSKVSCLCEAIERYSGIFQGYEARKQSSYVKLKKDVIHPASCLLYSDNQYANREVLNQNCIDFHSIPVRFDEEKVVDWTPLWSLTENRFKWLPTGLCYYNYPFPSPHEKFCSGDSNGAAAGNTIEEAIIQGFLELIERDAIALWWYSRIQMPGVDLTSFTDPYVHQLIEQYAAMNRELWVIDISVPQQAA